MVYLEQFRFPDQETENNYLMPNGVPSPNAIGYYSEVYPFRMIPEMGLHSLDFEPITILCGGNGSGKSTILNVIARKLNADRSSPYNSSHQFEDYVDLCQYSSADSYAGEEIFRGTRNKHKYDISTVTRVITSDDIFHSMLDHRRQNDQKLHKSYFLLEQHTASKREELPKHLNLETGYNVEEFRTAVNMRKQSFNKFMSQTVGRLERGFSNGETALMKLSETLERPGLYILDEPENSMSCEFQLKLAELIRYFAIHGNCQFVIATHSPFLLALENAKIYNFDVNPVTLCNWWEASNVRHYLNFFEQHRPQIPKH